MLLGWLQGKKVLDMFTIGVRSVVAVGGRSGKSVRGGGLLAVEEW